jgi:Protein of unknown function (DUF2786)
MSERNDNEQERVLGRIRKMMRLAEDSAASQGERDNAMRMVHATLAKHNLTMSMAEEKGATAEEAREKGDTTSRDQPWCRTVGHAVGELYFCQYFYTKLRDRAGKVRHNFVGRAGNVETAKLMTDYVVKSITSEANRLWKLQPDPGPWWTSFCKGAAEQVRERCHKLRAEAEAADKAIPSTGTALVLASVYAAEEAANALWVQQHVGPLHRRADRTKGVTFDGYAAGKAFGAKVSLHRQVSGVIIPKSRRLA